MDNVCVSMAGKESSANLKPVKIIAVETESALNLENAFAILGLLVKVANLGRSFMASW